MCARAAYTSMRRLRQLLQTPVSATGMAAAEHCELCNELLATNHRHLWDWAARNVVCVCSACSLLMIRPGAAAGKYRLIPERYLAVTDFELTTSAWSALLIPVNMAFLVQSAQPEPHVSAFYPGPAGAIESVLDTDQWQSLLQVNPVLAALEAEVEALLINRMRAPYTYYLVPIDSCYRLVGLLRRSWHGFSGGDEAWQSMDDYFVALQAQAMVCDQLSVTKGSVDARSKL
ncbi:hypothetical protein KDW_52750 [Dictyobacter vulcani]|uniref:Uncharacterized protein n=1 Tax=Dictyobacter vulcani TaxID=2607529 RepID=A0A5J4KTW9_9CHLR|nr:DUF5947 family protein [Dictyobacter vulcani]GER91113.1 hypothetical protein KDW_52750 [Dictyobacter vulcani]